MLRVPQTDVLFIYTVIQPEMNSGLLHEGVRKDEESERQGCGLETDCCLKYQHTIMLRLDCVKNGEKFWVLRKIQKTL